MAVTAPRREDPLITLHAFGESRLELDGGRALTPAATRGFACLLRLALAGGRPLDRDRLAAELWPGATTRAARHALRQLLYRLRGLGAPIVVEPARVRLPAAQVATTLDLAVALEAPPSALGAALREALAAGDARLGPWLPDYAPSLSPAYDDWLDAERARAEGRVRRALDALLAEGAALEVAARTRAAAALLSLDPLNRRARTALTSDGERDTPDATSRVPSETFGVRRPPARADTDRWRAPLDRWPPAQGSVRVPSARTTDVGAITSSAAAGAFSLLGSLLAHFSRSGASVVRVDATGAAPHTPAARLIARLLDAPGALGCAPEALASLRRWLVRASAAGQRDEPSASALPERELRELLDAVCDEAPLVVLLGVDARTTAGCALLGVLARVADPERMLALAIAVTRRLPAVETLDDCR